MACPRGRCPATDVLTRLGRQPQAAFRGGRIMGEVHAAMHETVAPPALPDVRYELRRRIEDAAHLPDDLRVAALAVLDGLPGGDAARGDPHADLARTALLHRVGEAPPGSPLVVRLLAPVGRRILRSGYLAAHRRRRGRNEHRPVDADVLDRWTVVNAASRLAEGIPAEHPQLLRLLRARLSVASAP